MNNWSTRGLLPKLNNKSRRLLRRNESGCEEMNSSLCIASLPLLPQLAPVYPVLLGASVEEEINKCLVCDGALYRPHVTLCLNQFEAFTVGWRKKRVRKAKPPGHVRNFYRSTKQISAIEISQPSWFTVIQL